MKFQIGQNKEGCNKINVKIRGITNGRLIDRYFEEKY